MDVVMLNWPADGARREQLALSGEPRLLLVEEGHGPPAVVDCLEDWLRLPAPDDELRARVDALSARSRAHDSGVPSIDGDGVLRHRGAWVSLPRLEARLVSSLLQRFGAVVGRESLIRAAWPHGSPGRNALDVQILRLRRRIAPVGLAVRTVRSRGYLLEQERPQAAGPDGERAPATAVYARLA